MKSIFSISKVACLSLLVIAVASCGGKEDRVANYLEKGKGFLTENNLKKARIEFKNVLQIDPKFPQAYYYMGQLEEKNKELRKAIGYYQKASELDPKYLDPKIKLARIFIIAGTKEYMAKAKGLLNEVLAVESNNLEAKLISATIDYKTGDKASAVKKIEAIVLKDLTLIKGVSLLAAIYDNDGRKDKAISVLEKGNAANKDNIPLKMSLAKVYASTDKIPEAEKQLLEIVNLDPEKYSYRIILSKFYTATDRNAEAEKVLRDAIAADDEDIKRYLALVEFLSKNKSIKDAESELLKMIEADSDIYEFKFALAEFYQKTGVSKKVKVVLEEIIDEKAYKVEGFKARTRLAKVYFEEKNIPEATRLLKEVLKNYPNDNEALFITSKIAVINNDAQTAINGLRTILKSEPTNVDAAKLLAGAHEMSNETGLAEDVLKNSIGSAPLDYKTHLNYATYLASKKNLTDAEDVLDKAILYFKDEYELLDLKLKIAAANKDESEIAKTLAAMKAGEANRYEPYVKQGQYYLAKKQYTKAMSEFEQALTRTKDKYKVLELIVKAYLIQKSPEKAIARLNKRLAAHANEPASYHLLGKVYASQKKYTESRNSFRKAIDNAKTWMDPYKALAAVYMVQGDVKNAEKTYKEAIKNATSKFTARMQLAALYEKEKQYDKAMEQYEKILSNAPDNNAVKNNLAALLLDHSSSDASIQKAKALTSGFVSIEHPALKDTLAWVHVKLGENDKARELLEKVVEKSPDTAVFKYHLGIALNNLGEKARAKKLLTESVNSKQEFTGKDQARKLIKSL
jgi:Tfp pilus assembly protein PilF